MTTFPSRAWVIQHIPTGKYMPAHLFAAKNRGWSMWEPWENWRPYEDFPRFFASRAKASNSLGQFLRGPLREQDTGRSFLWAPPETRVVNTPTANHIPEDFQILSITIGTPK